MYVETMTFNQIAKEIEKDVPYLKSKIQYLLGDSKYRKICLKLKEEKYHTFKRIDFTSKTTGFEYHIIPFVFSKRDYLKFGVKYSVFLTFRMHNQIWSCNLCDEYRTPLFFTPHFFDRYELREGIESESRLELMTVFFTRNHSYIGTAYNHSKHPDSIFVTMDEGIGLGTMVEGSVVLVKTYISNGLLHKNQTDIQSESKTISFDCYTSDFGKNYSFNVA